MPEIKVYTCNGGCGATTVLDQPTDIVTRNGWYLTFTPAGEPTLYCCSPQCLIKALEPDDHVIDNPCGKWCCEEHLVAHYNKQKSIGV